MRNSEKAEAIHSQLCIQNVSKLPTAERILVRHCTNDEEVGAMLTSHRHSEDAPQKLRIASRGGPSAPPRLSSVAYSQRPSQCAERMPSADAYGYDANAR